MSWVEVDMRVDDEAPSQVSCLDLDSLNFHLPQTWGGMRWKVPPAGEHGNVVGGGKVQQTATARAVT